jgi:hypothetical protein
MSSPLPPVSAPRSGRALLLLGLACPLLGLLLYTLQLSAQRLFTPWYMPALSLIGLVFVFLAIRRRRVVWRRLAFLLVALVLGAQLTFLFMVRLPAYQGPLEIGKPFPAFQTLRADDSPFSQADLPGPQNTVLVFFRGRW